MTLARINDEDIGHRSAGYGGDVIHSLPQQPRSRDHIQSWEIRNKTLPQLKQGEHNAFEMLPNGSCLRAYETSCSEAARHASGWSMRNTNNHNTAILKKSCLGVLVCSRRHTTCPSRPAVHLKPAICHKARAKQIGRPCPSVGCEGQLELRSCHGLSGNPVTHFWRTEGNTVYFQAKGVHDHPAPVVYHRTSTSRPAQPRLRERRSRPRPTSATRALASKSVKVTAKVKIKVEQPDEVTCSTDEVRCRSAAAAAVAKRESSEDGLLPDTTTENLGDVIDDSSERATVTSFGDKNQSVSNRTATAVTLGNHGSSPHVQQLVVPLHPTASTVGQPYGLYPHQYQYVSMPQAAPLCYCDDAAQNAGRFTDDIDDILSVMASVAGITQPPVFHY